MVGFLYLNFYRQICFSDAGQKKDLKLRQKVVSGNCFYASISTFYLVEGAEIISALVGLVS